MKEEFDQARAGVLESEETAASSLVPQVRMMVRALWASPLRNVLLLLAAAVFFVIVATAYGQIRLNRWNKPFYDALAHRDFSGFVFQLSIFGIIATALLILNVVQRWVTEMLKLKLRDGLTRDLVENWMSPGRAFRLASAGPIGINPDQRMHEDARHLTELSADLGIGLLQASILLITFVNILWALSSGYVFHIGSRLIAIPGYMVWAGIVYAGSASLLSYWVGKSLIDRNAERYAREADLRYSLVRVNEHVDAVSLAAGEADELRRLKIDLAAVLAATRRLVTGLTQLTWVTAGYGWFTLVAPILVAAPLYFEGTLSFGGLMMAAGAFTQVQSSLRWFVDNFSLIADWRATLLRVASFRRAIIMTDTLHDVASRIAFEQGPPGEMTIENLEIASPAGCIMLKEVKVQLQAGERILVLGEHGAGKTLLFRALAGLWPWGSGRIAWPKGAALFYMPRTPYLPAGTLAEVLAYPQKVENLRSSSFAGALQQFGLSRLVPMLDVARRWDRELSDDEQQSLSFSRLLLHAPTWVLIDEVLDSIDAETRGRALSLFEKELKETTLIYIGRAQAADFGFTRVLHLINDPSVRRLVRRHAASASTRAEPKPAAMAP